MSFMDRRGFLQALGASIAAIVAAPAIGFTSVPFLSPSEPLAIDNPLRWMTLRMAQHIAHRVGKLELVEGNAIGYPGLTHHFNVGVQLYDETLKGNDYEHRYVLPAAEAFATRMKRVPVRRVGKLDVPTGVDQVESVWSEQIGMALRGMNFYYAPEDTHMLRFDVLCG
jgi:hypothetical protein